MTKEASPRRRDAAASRDRLLKAAGELFADRGYDRTTARDIGERAGVDPTMIARYFGGKAQLYIAVLRAQEQSDHFADLLEVDRLSSLLDRFDRGPGAIIQSALRPYDDAAAQSAALAELEKRIVGPLRERLTREGDTQAALRAELIAAAFTGVILGRHAGTLKHLAEATNAQLLDVLQDLLGAK
ncbi:MAG TPA: TetR family transcriptional regulator [Mycobacterium sp.]|jgi:AcrR family transcriptional regulator|nr:TetR family transcriptional regulator [Mycobacterium sp.]